MPTKTGASALALPRCPFAISSYICSLLCGPAALALLCDISRPPVLILSPHHTLQTRLILSVFFKKLQLLLFKVLCKMPSTPEMAFLLVCEGHCSVPSLLGSLGANRLFPFLAQSLYIHYILVTGLSDVSIRNSTQTGLGNTRNILKNPGEHHSSRRAGSKYSNSALRNLPPLSLSFFSFSLFHTHTQTHVHTNIKHTSVWDY